MDARPCTRCLNTRCARIVIVRRWASERCWRRPRDDARAREVDKVRLGSRWMSFREASDRASAIASGLVDLAGLKPRDKVIIYADTKRDWQLVARASQMIRWGQSRDVGRGWRSTRDQSDESGGRGVRWETVEDARQGCRRLSVAQARGDHGPNPNRRLWTSCRNPCFKSVWVTSPSSARANPWTRVRRNRPTSPCSCTRAGPRARRRV